MENKTFKINEENKTITVLSEMVWQSMLQSKEIAGKEIDTVTDDTGKTKDGYFVISHFTHTAKASKAKKTSKKAVPAKKESGKDQPIKKVIEVRAQDFISSSACYTVKVGNVIVAQLAELPTAILDVAIKLRDGLKPALEIKKDKKDYAIRRLQGYKDTKSYQYNCGKIDKQWINKALVLMQG